MIKTPFYQSIADKSLAEVAELGEQILQNLDAGIVKLEASSAKNLAWLKEVENFESKISYLAAPLEILDMVHPDKKFREWGAEFSVRLANRWSDYGFNQKIFNKYRTNVDSSNLDNEARYLHDRTMSSYRRYGVDKTLETRKKLKKIQNQMAELSNKFGINIANNTPKITLKPEQLKGCFKEFISSNTNKAGKVEINLVSSAATQILQNCEVRATREEVRSLSLNYAKESNWEVLPKYLNLANKYAALAGYKNYAWLATEDKMIESPTKSAQFIEDLISSTKGRVNKELKLIKDLKSRQGDKTDFSYSDIDFYGSKVARQLVEFDEEGIKEFFPYEHVRGAVLEIFEEMFGIEFRPLTMSKGGQQVELWHKDVQAYEVSEGGKQIGLIYLDMHPRKGKYNHACSVGIVGGLKDRYLPQNILICNFTKPEKGKSMGLQSFDEVETFFHEFGHLVHAILGGQNQEWSSFTGTSVQLDFVEAPSQLLEEIVIDRAVLKKLSKHYQTGQQIDEASIDAIEQREKIFSGSRLKGLHIARQAALSKQSLQIYTSGEVTNSMLAQIERDSVEEVFGIYGDYQMIYEFGHVVGGYSSNYYTYMWSLAISKDMFTKFNKSNLLDPSIGEHYRKTILEPGGSKPAADLIKDFLGRDWNLKAFETYLKEGIEVLDSLSKK